MPTSFPFGVDLDLPESPRWPGGLPIVRVCDLCGRVQGGPADETSEAKWMDKHAYIEAHGVAYGEVWWWHTLCERCDGVG
jgi:hypothetical protein